MIVLNSEVEIEGMRLACKNASALLKYLGKFVKPGLSTEQIDKAAAKWVKERDLINAPLGYTAGGNFKPYPNSICTSVNSCICHGYPSEQLLRDGDIVNIDVSPITNGWYGDTSETFLVGEVSSEAKSLVDVTRECLRLGTEAVKPGGHLGDIGAAIAAHAHANGFSVVKEFVGHGIGRKFHTKPVVAHFGKIGSGIKLKPGMIFTIEPMINSGSPEIRMLDEWVSVTEDDSLSAQFEWTVLVTEKGAEILTK